jgi:hypothetical protein
LSEEEKKAMIAAPYETKSDTFFFVDGKLIIHNRAAYNYAPL